MMMMMMMILMLCKSHAQVRDLCVEIYHFKLPVMQKTPIFTTFSAHQKMAADKRGQIKVFGRKITIKIIKVSFKSSNIFLESRDLKRLLSVHSAAFCHLCHFLFDGVTEFGPAWFQSQSGGTNLEITTSSLPFPGHISQRFFL